MDDTHAREALHRRATPAKARALQRFFMTGKGAYSEHDIFIGVTVPEIRQVAAACAALKRPSILKLLRAPVHEERLLALLLLIDRYSKGNAAEQKAIFTLYLKNAAFVNNWDLVDLSAAKIVGSWLLGKDKKILDALARSRNMWERRIAIVATHAFIRDGLVNDTFHIAGILLGDQEDLIHKAAGWMLREAGKRDMKALKAFLKPRLKTMPRTMLRYAIERFPEKERQVFLQYKA